MFVSLCNWSLAYMSPPLALTPRFIILDILIFSTCVVLIFLLLVFLVFFVHEPAHLREAGATEFACHLRGTSVVIR